LLVFPAQVLCSENLLYRFNQIPDATKLAFLGLLQLPLRPAMPARPLVTLRSRVLLLASTTKSIATEPLPLPPA
jgi:hypothetical protein